MQYNKNIYNKLLELYDYITIDNLSNPDPNNKFRLYTLKKTLAIIKSLDFQIKNGNDLAAYPGIGKRTIEKINEIISTGSLSELKNNNYNTNLLKELSQVVGIGPAIAIKLIKKYNVTSLQDLINRKNQLNLNDKILLGLNYVGKFFGNIPRKEMNIYNKYLTSYSTPTTSITICGSYRRGLPTSNDIDVLLCSVDLITMDDINNSNLLEEFVNKLKKDKFIKDDISMGPTKYMGFCKYGKYLTRRIDIRLIPLESYYSALVYFTGSYELNRIMRLKAKSLNLKLNEYGLYKNSKQIDIMDEQDIFKKLNMKYLEPDERNIS
jgi:DNA polymerase/3'-5' exonuclease PolX